MKMAKIMATNRLTDEQINKLLAKYAATKDIRIRDKVVLQYKNLVESIARRFSGSGEPLEDLIQEGYIGLITATDLYDAKKGVKFSTYATHFIIGQIKHALRDRGKIIKEPAWLQELNHKMARVIDSLYQELGRQPTEAEIGRVMHLPEESVAELLTTREIFKVASLDNDRDEEFGASVDVEKVKDEDFTTFQLPVEDRVVLGMAMNKLKLIEQKVIQEFFYNGLSQTEIAKKLGISCNYVSHILRNGTRKLKRILTTEEIKEMQMQLQLAGRRQESPEESAITDAVTGVYTKSYMEQRLAEEVIRSARNKSKLSFALLAVRDLDKYGELAGSMHRDDALYSIARIIADNVRKCDIIGRMDDKVFGLIMPYTGEQASQVCERVSNAIKMVKFDIHRTRGSMTFDVEFGTAIYPDEAASAEELIDFAWVALETSQKKLAKAA